MFDEHDSNLSPQRWAIISDTEKKADTIPLTDWNDYEWKDFILLKDSSTEKIIWFDSEGEAVSFIFEKFYSEQIAERLIDKHGRAPHGYIFE